MALFNYATKEITLKIVYYGPGLSGKTTNLQYLHSIMNPETRGRLLSLSTETDRTLFFDFLPVELGKIRDFSIRFQLYTVPGQVRYNATRKIVLKGADAVIFVADSQSDMKEQNIESFGNMRENLLSNNINPDEIPVILQYNKRDLTNIASVGELNADLNRSGYPVIEACAIKGSGVEEAFKLITKLLMKNIAKKHQIEIKPAEEEEKMAEPAAVSQKVPPPQPFPASSVVHESAQKELLAASVGLSQTGVSQAEESPKELRSSIMETEQPRPTALQESANIPLDKIDRTVGEISEILTDIKNSMNILSQQMENLKELKREQKEAINLLKDISARIEAHKTKRRWFRF